MKFLDVTFRELISIISAWSIIIGFFAALYLFKDHKDPTVISSLLQMLNILIGSAIPVVLISLSNKIQKNKEDGKQNEAK